MRGDYDPWELAPLFVLAAASLTAGCGPSCDDVCDACAKSSDADPERSDDCQSACTALDDLSGNADCDDAWDGFVECKAEACDAASCASEADGWKTCVADYCAENPEDASCNVAF